MLFCIDIGNTNIVIGLLEGEEILRSWRLRTERDITADELGVMVHNLLQFGGIAADEIRHAIISSVVPPLSGVVEQFCRSYFSIRPMVVGPGLKTGMQILYDNPKEVGADRIVNAVGAYHKFGTALIVVDFGTATTFDYVSGEGAYCGGAIAPGILISCEALFQKASKLPRAEIFARPRSVIGKDTMGSMNAGILFGYAGLVDGIVRRMKKESGEDAKVVATGGLAPVIRDIAETIDIVEETLTLYGLGVLYRKNLS